MKKMMIVVLAMMVFAAMAVAQTAPSIGNGNPAYSGGAQGIINMDKLGAHQNGGRGCVGCHAPHSGARGNGGNVATQTWNTTTNKWTLVPTAVNTASALGDDALWGQDYTPILAYGTNGLVVGGSAVDFTNDPSGRILTGVAFCLSCHDGNVAKGAMMTNQAYEQAAGLLPATYGGQAIPTLLGADGGTAGNYENDHPIGQAANFGAVLGTNAGYFQLNSAKTGITNSSTYTGSAYATFASNYGSPTILAARGGAGFAVDTTMTDVKQAYVVCTTCHTPHSMYTAKIGSNVYPTFFFIAAPYNPGANVQNGALASSATQFCRQCHFTGAGGSNEGSGISIPTAW